MKLSVCCIGKTRTGPEAALVADYLGRCHGLARQIGFSGPDLKEFEAPRGLAGAKRTDKEGAFLLDAAQNAEIIALDERGANLTSRKFSDLMAKMRDEGAKGACFLIGGADGHADAVLSAASLKIALGKATWPHLLARAMLAEQLYRAMTILSGHPYHRG